MYNLSLSLQMTQFSVTHVVRIYGNHFGYTISLGDLDAAQVLSLVMLDYHIIELLPQLSTARVPLCLLLMKGHRKSEHHLHRTPSLGEGGSDFQLTYVELKRSM